MVSWLHYFWACGEAEISRQKSAHIMLVGKRERERERERDTERHRERERERENKIYPPKAHFQ
jgi:hypothetical protein